MIRSIDGMKQREINLIREVQRRQTSQGRYYVWRLGEGGERERWTSNMEELIRRGKVCSCMTLTRRAK